jgi:carbamoylphosphate synthase large subunit
LDERPRVLVTGAGGIAGVNFVRALKASDRHYYLAGSDHSKYYIEFPDLDARFLTPRHDDPAFVQRIDTIARRERAVFIHPQPSSEAVVISAHRGELPAKVFLPSPEVMEVAQDKLKTQGVLEKAKVRVARTRSLKGLKDIAGAVRAIGLPSWVRARRGAGGRLSLLCGSEGEARDWVSLWSKRGTPPEEFIIQEYLPGRNIAWDGVWKDGTLVTSYCRERIEYPFKHISPSGITGTPSVARTIRDSEINKAGERSVLAVDPKPSGAYSVDLKEDSSGRPAVTEVDAGKFHSTMPLWGYAGVKHLGLPWFANFADLYVRLGTGEKTPKGIPKYDALPAGYYMIRNIDSGVLLWREDGWKERVL